MSLPPFDQRDGYIWFNGSLVPWRDAKLHVLSHGLHYGSCVFEGERAYGGRFSNHKNTLQDLENLQKFLILRFPIALIILIKRKQRLLKLTA